MIWRSEVKRKVVAGGVPKDTPSDMSLERLNLPRKQKNTEMGYHLGVSVLDYYPLKVEANAEVDRLHPESLLFEVLFR